MAYEHSLGARARAGLLAGLLGGMVMGLVAMIRAASLGLGFWLPMKLISGLFWGPAALIGGVGAILAGMFVHLAVAGGSGMVFGTLVGGRLDVITSLLAGLVFGIAVWAVTTWLVLPWANEVMLERQMVAPRWWFAYHLIYGAALSMTSMFLSGQGARRRTEAAATT